MQSLTTISMSPIPMITRPCLTDCVHHDPKWPICGAFLPTLLMLQLSMTIAHLPCLPKKRLASKTLSLSQSMHFDLSSRMRCDRFSQHASHTSPFGWNLSFLFLPWTKPSPRWVFSRILFYFAAKSSTTSLNIGQALSLCNIAFIVIYKVTEKRQRLDQFIQFISHKYFLA